MSNEKTRGTLPAWRRWLPGIGTVATLLTTACCTGLPAIVSLVTAVGAGFLLTDRYLQPLLIAFVLVTVAASALTFWRHRNAAPLLVTVLSAGAIYWFIYRDYRGAGRLGRGAGARGRPSLGRARRQSLRGWLRAVRPPICCR